MKLPYIIMLYCMFGSLIASGNAEVKVFELEKQANTRLKWHGSELIKSDLITYLPEKDFAQSASGCETVKDKANWTVTNTWGKTEDMKYRKEVGMSPDGQTVELNVQMTQPPYKGPASQTHFVYSFKAPLATFAGMKWNAITGRGCYDPKYGKGVITASTPDGNFIGDGVRWLALEGNGKKLVFDFNPEGVTTFNDFGPNRIQGLWQIRKEGDEISFSFGRDKRLHGGTLNSKLLIFEGSFEDYMKRHAHKKYRYFSELPPALEYCFGAEKAGSGFIKASTQSYTEPRGFGWLNPQALKTESLLPSGALYTAIGSNSDAAFKTKILQPGLYLVTVRSAAYEKAAGSFTLDCNGKTVAENITVKPYSVKTIIWPQWLENGTAEFKFNGKWRVSTIALQVLQHSKEDYRFRRGFWRIAGLYEPSVMHKSAHYTKPPVFKTAITETPLPKNEIKDPAMAISRPASKICLPNQQSPEMAWRYDATIGSMGPGNNGNFDEFNTQQLTAQRLQELKAQKINTVLLNGFLSRHTYPNHLDRVQDMVTMTVAEGKKLNMKVIDHWDLTLLWNMGSGFRYLTEHTDWLQRTVDNNLPNRGLCPANPEFKEHFFNWVISFIKNTGIDGIMIDEVAFHGSNFCGCAHCRKQFHEATGLTLPLDETSPLLQNQRSKLWKSWLGWRLAVTTEWWVELRQRINKVNPDFTMMRYTTHYGLRSTYGSLVQGASLNGAAHGCDFIGTEIMSRNVLASYRAVAAYRKFKNAFRETYGSPVFGLVYPGNVSEFAYFGWALNNMNGQVTWYISGIPEGKVNFTAFADNMDLRLARPAAETAILFSIQSRDWGQTMPYYPSPLGTAECMNDLHMQYTTLLDPCLKYEKLKQYKTVMIPSASCLSDQQINELLKYVRNGGRLFVSAHAGMFDAIGNPRKVWPFAEPLGLSNPVPMSFVNSGTLHLTGTDTKVNTNLRFIRIRPDKGSKSETILTLTDKAGREFIVGVKNNYGKGRIFYISGQLANVNMEPERTVSQKWTFAKNRPMFELFAAVLKQATGDAEAFIPLDVPEKVLCTVYRQQQNGRTATIVHLLNATGTDLKPGQIVPKIAPTPAFPELKNDIKFKVKLPGFQEAYAASPEFAGHQPVIVKQLTDNWYEVTVPRRLLKCYSTIWFR